MTNKPPLNNKPSHSDELNEFDNTQGALSDTVDHKPLLICHIIYRLDFGGLENGLVNLINHLPTAEFRHAIICLKHATEFQERIKTPNVKIFEVNKHDGKDISAYFKVYRLVRELKPDIVHTRNIPTIDMVVPALLAGARHFVHSEHGLDITEVDGRHKKYNRVRWLSQLAVKNYITVSRDLATWLNQEVGIPSKKISVIYNGVDTKFFRPTAEPLSVLPQDFAQESSFVIGTIGRLEHVKDQITLTKAFLRLLELRPTLRSTIRLVIIGDGTLRSKIEAMLEHAGANHLAWLPGFRSDVNKLFRSFSVFVLPSRREGISNTILEAMASGSPVIATRVGGNPEIVKENVTGQLVPADDPDAIATALLRYIDEQELTAEHGQAARDSANQYFSLAAMVNNYSQLYKSL